MKNFMKGFIVATLIFALAATCFATSKKQSIEVELNPSTIVVDGDEVKVDHFAYKGTTYVPIRAISENLEMKVDWDNKTKTIFITPIEPRMWWNIAKYIPLGEEYEVNEEYEAFLEQITTKLDDFITYLIGIDLGNKQLDLEDIEKLETRRAEIENEFYSKPFGITYRTSGYRFLKALDYVETAIYRSYDNTTLPFSTEKVRKDLEKARSYNNITPAIGF